MKEIIAGITTIASATSLGSVTVATVPIAVTTTVSAGGIAGLLGFTATTTTIVASPVAVPLGVIIATGLGLAWGGKKVYEYLKDQQGNAASPAKSP